MQMQKARQEAFDDTPYIFIPYGVNKEVLFFVKSYIIIIVNHCLLKKDWEEL